MNEIRETQERYGGTVSGSHSLTAVNRKEMTVTGVREVISFDSELVRLVTVLGVLNLEGKELRIHVLNTRDGVVTVTGILCGVLYEDISTEDLPHPPKGKRMGRFGGLFRH